MKKSFFDYIIHGGDYNPDQWIDIPEIWDEDMRPMKLAHINSATVGIFSWSMLEREYTDILDSQNVNGEIKISPCSYIILK